MKKCFAIEFDTFKNEFDPNDNHISAHRSLGDETISSVYSIASNSDIFNLKDGIIVFNLYLYLFSFSFSFLFLFYFCFIFLFFQGNIHFIKIIYDGKNLKVWGDNSSDSILDFEIDFKEIFPKNEMGLHECHLGFTASTG